jgi:hypothetical protein
MLPGRPLPEVLADILSLEGALLEKSGDGGLEFVAPLRLARQLALPEHGKLVFAQQPSGPGTFYAGYDSEFFQAMADLFAAKPRAAMATHPGFSVSGERLSAAIHHRIVFANGTFRLKATEPRPANYVLGFFKYTALSDEKREGLFALLANGLSGSVVNPGGNLPRILEELAEADPRFPPPAPEIESSLRTACAAAPACAAAELAPYIQSADRRLNRDGKRVCEYYAALKREAERAAERKALAGEISREKIQEKLQAIEAERKWKMLDLVSKYSLSIRLDPFAAVGIATSASLAWIEIRRRLSSRTFPVVFNPLTRSLDPLPCESCRHPRGGYFLCDEKLHIVCAVCFQKCPRCAKPFCPVCHPKGCPRCGSGGRSN